MESRDTSSGVGRCALRGFALVAVTLITVMLSLVVAYAAPSEWRLCEDDGAPRALPPLPPPPSPPPEAAAPSTFTGGFIELSVQFPQTWPAQGTHWQNLWTTVQWLDDADCSSPTGTWRDVESWQGSLDTVTRQVDGTVVGHKTWWASEDDLGKGPFRWRVYRSQGGALIATSETFDLPSQRHATTAVEVTLAQ